MHADPDLRQLADTYFEDRYGHEVVAAAEDADLDAGQWKEVVDLQLNLIAIPEEHGGAGGTLPDLVAVLVAAGRNAAPLPLVEANLASWLAGCAGLAAPTGVSGVAVTGDVVVDGDRLSGTLPKVAWGRSLDSVVVVAGAQVVRIDGAHAVVRRGVDLAGQPHDDLTFDGAPVERGRAAVPAEQLRLRGLLLRAALMAGATDGAFALTRSYTDERVQFGKPVGRFQAVAQHVVTLAQAASMSLLGVERAAAAMEQREAAFEVLACDTVVRENAALAARASHQAHGAIGMTQEYRLQQLTRRLNAWRLSRAYGGGSAAALGTAVSAQPSLARLIFDAAPTLEDAR
ncbi:acyl-CoA dehydrogenase family protein [Mumia sp. DW29H23]|uniref:acyl-CoA dehydrogenase family protein n=1 Tax=Mumia sp. DW29H23 TaxID=3421241 RepID=UPI003D69C1F9